MAGNKFGAIKKKLGLKGKTPVGAMISRMNKMKIDASKEGESLKHEKSESKSFEKKEKKGLVTDKADKGRKGMKIKSLI